MSLRGPGSESSPGLFICAATTTAAQPAGQATVTYPQDQSFMLCHPFRNGLDILTKWDPAMKLRLSVLSRRLRCPAARRRRPARFSIQLNRSPATSAAAPHGGQLASKIVAYERRLERVFRSTPATTRSTSWISADPSNPCAWRSSLRAVWRGVNGVAVQTACRRSPGGGHQDRSRRVVFLDAATLGVLRPGPGRLRCPT